MKLKSLILTALFALGAFLASNAQNKFKLEVEQSVVDTVLYLDFYITKTSGADFRLGSSNFAVNVNAQALDLTKMFKVPGVTPKYDISFDPASYVSQGLGGAASNFVHVAVRKFTAGSGQGQLVSSVRELVGRVGVPIVDACGFNNCTWVTGPVAFTDFPGNSIKANATFVNPDAGFKLCSQPNAPVVNGITGAETTLCAGESMTVSANSNFPIQWYKDGNLVASTGNNLTITEAGNYVAKAVNCNCVAEGSSYTVVLGNKPEKAEIELNAGLLTTTATTGIQWYLNGVIVPGATGTSLVPTSNGLYSVGVTNNCGTTMSDEFNYSITGAELAAKTFKLEANPNPYKGKTVITYNLPKTGSVKVEVFTVLAEKVATLADGRLSAGQHQVEFSASELGYAAGVYFIRLTSGENTQVLKVIEQ